MAGLPFSHPLESDLALIGQRSLWDSYYRYQPRVQWAPTFTYTLDGFGNMTRTTEVKTLFCRNLIILVMWVFHVRFQTPMATTLSKYSEQLSPEQGKYSWVLDLAPADPSQVDGLYEYIPTLRKSLRLSQAARYARCLVVII